MIRSALHSLLVALVHLFVMPPLALLGTFVTLVWRRSEGVPRVARPWARLTLFVAGVRLRLTGAGHLRGPAIAVMNHASAMDIYLACGYLPIPFRMVAKEQLFRIPVFGWALRAGGFVSLERRGGRRDVQRLYSIAWDPARRAVVGFYPEGTRSKDGRLKPFKKGAFAAAIHDQVPIIPVAIIGTHRVQPAGRLMIHGGPVEMRILEPIPTTGLGEADRDALARLAWERIRAELPPDQQPPA